LVAFRFAPSTQRALLPKSEQELRIIQAKNPKPRVAMPAPFFTLQHPTHKRLLGIDHTPSPIFPLSTLNTCFPPHNNCYGKERTLCQAIVQRTKKTTTKAVVFFKISKFLRKNAQIDSP
jgi:hypothetical protein